MTARRTGLLTLWLLVLAAAQVVAFVQLARFFVHTGHGQLLDTVALAGNGIGHRRIEGLVSNVLNAMSVLSLAIAAAVIGFIALIRGRVLLAVMAILLIVCANVTTQLLKGFIVRPDLGIDAERAAAGNSFPSGHTAVAASVAVALVLVLPPRVRGLGAFVGAAYAALAGVATLSAGWHRPSDAVAALLVVGAWTALACLVLVAAQRREALVETGDAHRFAVVALILVSLALAAVTVLAIRSTEHVLATPPEGLGRRRLLTAYAGSAAAITGTATLLTALVLATVHRVVPRRPDRRGAVRVR